MSEDEKVVKLLNDLNNVNKSQELYKDKMESIIAALMTENAEKMKIMNATAENADFDLKELKSKNLKNEATIETLLHDIQLKDTNYQLLVEKQQIFKINIEKLVVKKWNTKIDLLIQNMECLFK